MKEVSILVLVRGDSSLEEYTKGLGGETWEVKAAFSFFK